MSKAIFRLLDAFKIGMDGSVVVAACGESSFGEVAALCFCGACALLVEQIEQRLVFGFGGYDDCIVEIFCCSTDE